MRSKLVVVFLITAVLFGGLPTAASADSPVACQTRGQAATDSQGRSLLCSSSCKKTTGLPLAWVVKGSCALSAPASNETETAGGTAAPTAVPPQPERPPEPPTAAPAAAQTTAETTGRVCVEWFLFWCIRFEGADAPTPTTLAPVAVPLPTPPLGTPQPADPDDLRDWGFNPGDPVTVVSLGTTIMPGYCPAGQLAKAFWAHVRGRRPEDVYPLIEEAVAAAAAYGVDIYATRGGGTRTVMKITVKGVHILLLTGIGAPPTAFDAPADRVARELRGATKRNPASKEVLEFFQCLQKNKPTTTGEWAEARALADREYHNNSRFVPVPEPAPFPIFTTPPEGSVRAGSIFVPEALRELSDFEVAGLVTAGVLVFVGVVALTGGGAGLVFVFAAF